MRLDFKAGVGLVFALALSTASACTPPPNPFANSASSVGSTDPSQNSFASASPSRATIVPGRVDEVQSRALSNYLKGHHLPLVGAQVIPAADGRDQVILFGFVASPYGQTDAEGKTKKFLNDKSVVIDNRIKVNSELANAGPSTPEPLPPDQQLPPDQMDQLGSVQAYQNQQPPDQYVYQSQGYGTSMGSGGLSMMIPLLGMLVGGSSGFGYGGGSGLGYGGGGFGTGYGSYGSYGYPSYPPPMPGGFGYGSPAPPPYAPF